MRWLILLSLLFLGCSSLSHKPNGTNLTELVKANLYPFDGYSYDNVSVKVNGKLVYVKARCSELDGVDEYLFLYDNGTLILKSYCLEALPKALKDELIDIALSNATIAENAEGVVTVRRILPQTSAKFYKPKELFSVTWHGNRVVSALIDLDEEKVVRIYVSPSRKPNQAVSPSFVDLVQR